VRFQSSTESRAASLVGYTLLTEAFFTKLKQTNIVRHEGTSLAYWYKRGSSMAKEREEETFLQLGTSITIVVVCILALIILAGGVGVLMAAGILHGMILLPCGL